MPLACVPKPCIATCRIFYRSKAMSAYVCYGCGSLFDTDQEEGSDEVACTECGSIDTDSQSDYEDFANS